jgi:deferrochelatase/peroxidase EfeB
MSFVINLDYTGSGRVEVKIQVMANNHEEAFKTAQNILNQQKELV